MRSAAQTALRSLASKWGIQPVNLVPVGHGIVDAIAAKIRAQGLLPDEETHDALILAESAVLECSMLLTSDAHLREIDHDRLALLLNASHVASPIIERAQGRPFIVRWADVPELMSGDFAARIAAFVAAYGALRDAETDLALARAEWDILEERAVAVMKAYGHTVKGNLGDGSRLAASLPQLWPGPRRGERRGKAGRSSKAAGQEADASG